MSPEICQDPAAQPRHWGPLGCEGSHTAQSKGWGSRSPSPFQENGSPPPRQREPADAQGRASAGQGPRRALRTQRAPQGERRPGSPVLPAKPPGEHACLPPGGLPPCGPRVPTLKTIAAWVPVMGPGGAARLVTDLCSQGPAPGRARAQLSGLSLEPRAPAK